MKKLLTAAWIVFGVGTSVAAYAQNTTLRVGAAKVDVTPAQADLPKNYDGIHDHIYSRAIVIDNGPASAALITVDAGVCPTRSGRPSPSSSKPSLESPRRMCC